MPLRVDVRCKVPPIKPLLRAAQGQAAMFSLLRA
jgi:hypothetical protein